MFYRQHSSLKGLPSLLKNIIHPEIIVGNHCTCTSQSRRTSRRENGGSFYRALQLFHTQTIHWERNDDGTTERCQLITFRQPLPQSSSTITKAITVDDTTSAKTAFHQITRGNKWLIYSGGDYHNARQLLSAIKRKIIGKVGKQTKKRKGGTKVAADPTVDATSRDTNATASSSSHGDDNNPIIDIDIGKQWIQQRKQQQIQSNLLHKLLLRVSFTEDNDGGTGCRRPNQILGLKRIPSNVDDIFAYAFQNDSDREITIAATEDEEDTAVSKHFVLPLIEFVAMIGGYEWHRKGVYIHALQDTIIPHFGVFPPTRQDYIQLILDNVHFFDRTKKQNNEEQQLQQQQLESQCPISMMEIGIGTGVLSLLLLQHKMVHRVIGTDINPYAVACAKENFQRFGYDANDVVLANLFPPESIMKRNGKVDMTLFNPPWIPGDTSSWLDKAVYDPDQHLLRQFLLQVQHYVKEDDGEVYLILSNLGMLLGLFHERDLYAMFDEGNLELVDVHSTATALESNNNAERMPNSRSVQTKKKMKTKKKKKMQNNNTGFENVRAKERISLYRLCVRR